MISLLPFILMVFSALIVYVLNRFKINLGRLWLVASVLALINWVFVLVLYWQIPFQIKFENWFPVAGIFEDGFSFSLDQYSWLFVFSICAIQLGIILSESTRITETNASANWISTFVFSAFGVLISISNNLLTIVIVWTLIDLVEFGIVQGTISKIQQSKDIVVALGVRLGGTLLLILAALFFNNYYGGFSFGEVPLSFGVFVMTSIGLRLGVFPFNLPYRTELPLRRGLGNSIRKVSVVSSVVVLNRFVIIGDNGFSNNFIYLLIFFAALSSSVLWLLSKNELDGRPFWIVSNSGLVIISFLTGGQQGAISWGITLLLIGSMIFLYSDRSRWLNLLMIFAVVSMAGYPFTPNIDGWLSLFITNNLIATIFNFLPVLFLLFGALRLILKPGKQIITNERWVWLVYPLGLIFLFASYWIVFILNSGFQFSLRVLWASIPVSLIVFAFSVFYFHYRPENQYSEWARVSSERVTAFVSDLLKFNWLYSFIWNLFQFLQSLVLRVSLILEGNGGMIWVFVLLALVLTLTIPKG